MSFLNNKKSIILIALMLLANIFLLYKITYLKKYYKNNQHNTKMIQNPKIDFFNTNFQVGLLNNGAKIENIQLIDSLNRHVQLQDLFKNKNNILFCRFSELNCQECLIYSVVKLVGLSKDIGTDNIVFLGSYADNKTLNILKKQTGLQNMNVYNIQRLDIPAENIGYPYYFMLDNTLKISGIFVPNKSVPDLTNGYLKTITNRYFINNNSI